MSGRSLIAKTIMTTRTVMTVTTNGLFGESYYRDNLTNEFNVFVFYLVRVGVH